MYVTGLMLLVKQISFCSAILLKLARQVFYLPTCISRSIFTTHERKYCNKVANHIERLVLSEGRSACKSAWVGAGIY